MGFEEYAASETVRKVADHFNDGNYKVWPREPAGTGFFKHLIGKGAYTVGVDLATGPDQSITPQASWPPNV